MSPVEQIFKSTYGIKLFLRKPKKDKEGNPQYLTVEALKRLDWMKYEQKWYSAIGVERYNCIVDFISKEGAVLFAITEREILESITTSMYTGF